VKPGILDGFLTLTVFMVVLVMVVYAIGERLAGPRLGALAAIVTATLPGTFAFAREYVFALPTATFLACAAYAVLRSDGMRSRRWAIACGMAIGLMLLSRTMAISYVPGVLAAALIPLVIRGRGAGDLGRRFLNLGLLVVAVVAVAATWYARNLPSVVDYLTNYGYGKQSQNYGHEHALISWGRLRSVAEHMIGQDLFLPLATLFAAALIALAVVAVGRLRPESGRRAEVERILNSDSFGIAIILLVGYGALMTSQNGGDGFTYPLAILLPPLAVLALRSFPRATIPAVTALALVAVVNVVSTSTIWAYASHARTMQVPLLDQGFPLTRGAPNAVSAIRVQVPGPESVFDAGDARWVRADEKVSDMLAQLYGPRNEAPVVAFASRNRALSANSVQLANVEKYHQGIPMIQLEAEPSDSVATYLEELTDPTTGVATAMVTTSTNKGDFTPLVTQSYAETAARRLGFRKIDSLTLPDGRTLFVWKRGPGPSRSDASAEHAKSPRPRSSRSSSKNLPAGHET
jgi:hypothetical protein